MAERLDRLGRGVPCRGTGIPEAYHLIRLRSLTSLNDVKLDFISFLQTLISINLNGAVVHEDVRAAFTSEKAVAFRIVEPLDRSPVLRQCRALLAKVAMIQLIFWTRCWYDARKGEDGFLSLVTFL